MTPNPPLIEMRGVTKDHGGDRPLRIASFSATAERRVVVAGFDAAAAETFFHLISGAALPDEGVVRIAGSDTRTIATDTEWLMSLDRFGFVTHRAVLLESLGVGANLALPLTLDIDPMPADVRRRVQVLADDVDLGSGSVDRAMPSLDALGRARLHLGRALAGRPQLLLLERPTEPLDDDRQREAFGHTLRQVSERYGLGWIALSDDVVFARAAGGATERLKPATGEIARTRRWWPWS